MSTCPWKWIATDAETNILCPIADLGSAFPMHPANGVVWAGTLAYDTPYAAWERGEGMVSVLSMYEVVVGHNIKFDFLHYYKHAPTLTLPRIWDTQLAEYLITGQRTQYAALDDLISKYVGDHALKDDRLKEYWDKGVDTADIPTGVLLPYLENDVRCTAHIFLKQYAYCVENGLLPLVMSQMDALRATIVMNLHGMKLDMEYVSKQYTLYTTYITSLEEEIKLITDIEVTSNKQLSLYFFGGTTKEKVKEQDGCYKNGKPKYKTVERSVLVHSKYDPAKLGYDVGKSGYYSVDDGVLSKLAAMGDPLAAKLSTYREYLKIRDTYYANLVKLSINGFLYPQLNHCSTKTGRLSCNKPNLQNQTDVGDVKRAYVSRFGNDGCILELDYSQLEMVALAFIADDKQLIDDINNGRDMHRELYKEMYGRYPTDKERKPFKRFSFLLVYGGGASTLMAQSGCDRATAKRFIDTFYKRYKGVKAYHERIVEEAAKGYTTWYTPDKAGPQKQYTVVSPTGRRYIFDAYFNERTKDLQFSPTELKNWPIQGFATGDIVPMMVGMLLNNIEEAGLQDDALLVMTVHDSVILDVKKEHMYETAVICRDTLESAPAQLKAVFNIDFPCKLSVGVEAGDTWQDKEEYEL